MTLCKNTTITSQFLNCQERFFKEIVLVEHKSSQGIALFFSFGTFLVLFFFKFFFINLIYSGTLQDTTLTFWHFQKNQPRLFRHLANMKNGDLGLPFFFLFSLL